MRNPGAFGGVGHADSADGTVEGDTGEHEGRRCGVDRQHVVRVLLVSAEDGADDVDLVTEALRERRTQRSVDEPAGQDGLVGRLSVTTEERAGDLACGVGALFNVDGQGEEVRSFTNASGSGGSHQDDGVAHATDNRSIGELSEFPRLKAQGTGRFGDRRRNRNGLGHGVSSLLEATTCRFPVVGHLAVEVIGDWQPILVDAVLFPATNGRVISA